MVRFLYGQVLIWLGSHMGRFSYGQVLIWVGSYGMFSLWQVLIGESNEKEKF